MGGNISTHPDEDPIDGEVVVNTGEQIDPYFVFDVDIVVPCEYEGESIVLRLIFCNDRGEMICFRFPLKLLPCEIDCREEDRDEGGNRYKAKNITNDNANWNKANKDIVIYPNPVSKILDVEINNQDQMQHSVCIIDQFGRELLKQDTERSMVRVDVSSLLSGFYFVKIINMDGMVIAINKIFVLD